MKTEKLSSIAQQIAEAERIATLSEIRKIRKKEITANRILIKRSTCGECYDEPAVAVFPSGVMIGPDCLNKRLTLAAV